MTGAAGGGPDTAGTDPLTVVVADALDRWLSTHDVPPDEFDRAVDEVVTAVRAYQEAAPE